MANRGARTWRYAESMRRSLLLALVLGALPAACGPGGEPRRDLVLILAERPPAPGTSPTFERLLGTGQTFVGPLRHPDDSLESPGPLLLRVELFTGRHDANHVARVWPDLPSLPEAARLSGRRALGFTTPGGVTADAGFDEFARPGQNAGLVALDDARALPAALTTALDGLAKKDAAAHLASAPLLLFCDLGTEPDALEAACATLDAAGHLDDAFVVVLFTDPDARLRAVLVGPGLLRGEHQAPVDPRDVFPTLARLGRIPLPGILQGRDLLQ